MKTLRDLYELVGSGNLNRPLRVDVNGESIAITGFEAGDEVFTFSTKNVNAEGEPQSASEPELPPAGSQAAE